MFEDDTPLSLFSSVSEDSSSGSGGGSGGRSGGSSDSGGGSSSGSVGGVGGSGGGGSGRGDVLRRLIGGDVCKRAIFDVLCRGEWCSLFELWRAARSWDRSVGLVRVSTIMSQFQQVLGGDFLESRMGFDSAEWRVCPEFLRSVASILSEKSSQPRVDVKASEEVKEGGGRPSGGVFRSLLSRGLRDLDL
ncbi:MAG: hypothetical protein ACUVXA_02585 [Candidatus Jordarchaeum sp.]|uniref:hypothetical protein n=1 Tax=Candidatus Jordarchaeum sp. TaxID=2823881 RepID=UPI00404A38B6